MNRSRSWTKNGAYFETFRQNILKGNIDSDIQVHYSENRTPAFHYARRVSGYESGQ
jgi:hypothetical protein